MEENWSIQLIHYNAPQLETTSPLLAPPAHCVASYNSSLSVFSNFSSSNVCLCPFRSLIGVSTLPTMTTKKTHVRTGHVLSEPSSCTYWNERASARNGHERFRK